MKASTAATILRSFRSRLEVTMGLTGGLHDVYALWAAYKATGDKKFGKLAMDLIATFPATAHGMVVKATKGHFETIREAYKTLDLKGNEDYAFPKDIEQLQAEIALLDDKAVEQADGGPVPPATDEWAKSLGINEADIKKALDNDPDKSN